MRIFTRERALNVDKIIHKRGKFLSGDFMDRMLKEIKMKAGKRKRGMKL